MRFTIAFLYLVPLCAAQDFSESVRAAMAGSLEQQKASVQKQARAALQGPAVPEEAAVKPDSKSAFFTTAWPEPPQWTALASFADCDPMQKQDLNALVSEAAHREGLAQELIHAVIGEESGAKPCVVSPKGAQGLMQLMPETAREMGALDPFDPKQNVAAGTKLLKQLIGKYNGDLKLALGAYNAGSGRVDQAGGVPEIPETVNYVSDILSQLSSTRGQAQP